MSQETGIVILGLGMMAVFACIIIFGSPADPSIECVKAGGQWIDSRSPHCERKG